MARLTAKDLLEAADYIDRSMKPDYKGGEKFGARHEPVDRMLENTRLRRLERLLRSEAKIIDQGEEIAKQKAE